MKTVSARLEVQVNVNCPGCDEIIDLLNESETNDYDHNEEGGVIKQAVPDGNWHKLHQDFEINNVACTECKTEFNVKELEW